MQYATEAVLHVTSAWSDVVTSNHGLQAISFSHSVILGARNTRVAVENIRCPVTKNIWETWCTLGYRGSVISEQQLYQIIFHATVTSIMAKQFIKICQAKFVEGHPLTIFIPYDRYRIELQMITTFYFLVWAISEISMGHPKIKTCHAFQGRLVVHRLGLATINLYNKYEVSMFTQYKDMKGDEKYKNWGNFRG